MSKKRAEKTMTGIWHPWDTLMKLLMRKDAQALASLALPGVVVGEALDKELTVKNIEADFFFNASLNGLAIILHLEFQRHLDAEMDRRMWAYNATMDIHTGKPVYSIVVYLVEEEDLVGSPYVREVLGTGAGHHFVFQVIKLWEIAPEVLKQTEFEALLALLPLTQAGKSRETVEEMITELQARNRPDLLTLGYNFAGLVFTDEMDQQWLKERFEKMQDMMEGSWVYQEMTAKSLEKGREEGRQQGLQQAAMSIVTARFPALEQLAKVIIASVSDLSRLEVLIVELSTSSSQEQTKQLLLSLVSAA
jgi:predicted transposase YdaD